jgi:23S rRNA (cytosine1962-C5)-methyltransferase
MDGRWVKLQPGKDKKVRHFYPFVFRDELAGVGPQVNDGDLVRLLDTDGRFVAWGTYSATSRIAFRTLTLNDEPIDRAFFVARLQAAWQRRQPLMTVTNAFRVVHAEADFLPGLIVDRYADTVVVQVRTLTMERLKPLWLEPLVELFRPQGVLERSDMEGRREEGLPPVKQALYGTVPPRVDIVEHGLRFLVDVWDGLKTGFYLDQRDNRKLMQTLVRPGERFLDLFAYTGAFAIYAAKTGAESVAVEQRPSAIAVGQEQARFNGVTVAFRCGNVFDELPRFFAEGARFDAVVIDPPAIAKSKRELDSLKWAIWKLVHGVLPLLNDGGRMLVCTCTYHMDWTTLMEAVRLAASDRRVPLRVLMQTTQSLDHPVRLHLPESQYLRCLLLQRD